MSGWLADWDGSLLPFCLCQALMNQTIQQLAQTNPAMAQQAQALMSNPGAMQQAMQVGVCIGPAQMSTHWYPGVRISRSPGAGVGRLLHTGLKRKRSPLKALEGGTRLALCPAFSGDLGVWREGWPGSRKR